MISRHQSANASRAVTIATLLLTLLATLLFMRIAQAEPQVIEDVEFLYWNSLEPPPADADWKQLTLPFNSREDRSPLTARDADSPNVWFRFPLQRPVQSGRHSLYFWRYNLALSVFFNGSEIGGSSFRENRDTMSWNHPLLLEIQEPAWRPGNNEVLVRLYRSAWGGNFAPILFGETAELQQLWSERMFRQVEINEVLLAFGIGLTLVSFFLWGVRRNDTVYLWFSGMCLCWSIVTLHMIIYHNPIPYDYWLPLVHVAIDGAIFCMYGFIGRLIEGAKRVRREQLLLAWTVFASLSHFLVEPAYFFMVAYSFHLIGTIALGAIVYRVALQAWRFHQRQAVIITGALAIQIMLFVHNIFLMFFAPSVRWEGSIFYAHFGIPLLFLIFVGSLLSRFTSALETAENMNKELEQKVELSRRVIEKGFAERRLLEIKQAAEQERLKIYRDLHDDVGSKLLSIMHADRGSKLGDMARSALESLRQAVSRANHPDQMLQSFIDDIREETELRLRGSGHEVEWTQSGEIPELIVPSTVAFNLNRILKEIVSNIIRHAEAQRVLVQTTWEGDSIVFMVQDDGRGFDIDGPLGNGINNIISRAKEIGASVSWHSEPGTGTTICTVVPTDWAPESIAANGASGSVPARD